MAATQQDAVAKQDAGAKALEVAKANIYKVLNNENTLQAFKAAWPNGEVNPQQIATQAFSVIARRPEVLDCEPRSLVATIVEGTLLGLSFLPHLKQAHIVPFKETSADGKTKVKKATLIVGYMGMAKLASNSGTLAYPDAHVVYEKDLFDFELGLDPKLVHKPPKTGDRGKPIGVYATGKLKNGDVVFRYLPAEEVMFYREKSKSKDNGPWVTDEMAQWRKTAIRRLIGYLPMDEKTARAAMNDELAETGNDQVLAPEFFGSDYIDVPVAEDKPSKTEARKEALKRAQEKPPIDVKPEPATTSPEPSEAPEGSDPIRDQLFSHVMGGLDRLFPKIAQADVAVSEATAGKYQSRTSLLNAPMDVLQQVWDHLKALAEKDLPK